MIDRSRLLGNPEAFQPEYLLGLLSRGVINSISNLEKAIFSLEYVAQLYDVGWTSYSREAPPSRFY